MTTNTLLQRNLAFLKNAQPYVNVEKLCAAAPGLCRGEGGGVFSAEHHGFFLRLHSAYDPQREADLFVEEFLRTVPYGALLVLFGLGFGYRLRACLARLRHGERLLVIEPGYGILRQVCRHVDLAPLLPPGQVTLAAYDTPEELAAGLSEIFGALAESAAWMKLMGWRVYEKIFSRRHKLFLTAIQREMIQNKIRLNTMMNLSRLWYKNQIVNTRHLAQGYPADIFFGALAGRPAVMVAAGPSLDGALGLLGELQGRVFILCAYTAYNVLRRHGIRPNLVVSIDGNQILYPLEEGEAFDLPLLCAATSRPQLLDQHTGPKLFPLTSIDVFHYLFLQKLGKRFTELRVGESVACIMCDFLYKAGADPIVLVGQDLALAPQGRTHAQGTYYDGSQPPQETLLVPGALGGQVATTPVLSVFLTWFERYFRQHKGTRQFVNTSGGAHIPGALHCTLAQAAARFIPPADPGLAPLLASVYAKPTLLVGEEKRALRHMLAEAARRCGPLRKTLAAATAHSEKLRRLYQANSQPDSQQVLHILEQLKTLDAQLHRQDQDLNLLALPFQTAQLQLAKHRGKDVCEGLYVAERSKTLYTSLLESVALSLPLLRQAVADLDLQLEKEQAKEAPHA